MHVIVDAFAFHDYPISFLKLKTPVTYSSYRNEGAFFCGSSDSVFAKSNYLLLKLSMETLSN